MAEVRRGKVEIKQKMVCGGVYEMTDHAGRRQQGVMVSVMQGADGTYSGTVLIHGYAPKLMTEDSAEFQRMKLLGKPASPKVGRPPKSSKTGTSKE
jgi:hypothetical protein